MEKSHYKDILQRAQRLAKTITNVFPLNTFSGILGLFLSQHKFNEKLLKLLVAVVYAELFKTSEKEKKQFTI